MAGIFTLANNANDVGSSFIEWVKSLNLNTSPPDINIPINAVVYRNFNIPPPLAGPKPPSGAYSYTGETNSNAVQEVITNQQYDWNNQIYQFFNNQALKNPDGTPPSDGLTLQQEILLGLAAGLIFTTMFS